MPRTRPPRTRPSLQRLSLERLEPRLAPAGVVTASLVGGSLTLTGDAAANEVMISDQVDSVTIAPLNGTSVRIGNVTNPPGQAATIPSPMTGNLSAFMLGGNDVIKLFEMDVPGSIYIDNAIGGSAFEVSDTDIGGNLTIVSGSGFDTARFSGGNNISGNVLVLNGVGGSHFEYSGNRRFAIGGDLTISSLDGDNSVRVGSQASTFGEFEVGGRLTFTTGTSGVVSMFIEANTIDLGGLTATSAASNIVSYSLDAKREGILINGTTLISTGSGGFSGLGAIVLEAATQITTKSVSFVGGHDTEFLSVAAPRLTVDGVWSTNYAAANSSSVNVEIENQNTISGPLTVTGATRAVSSMTAGGATVFEGSPLTFGSSATFNQPPGSSVLQISGSSNLPNTNKNITVAGTLTVNAGAGSDNITIGRQLNLTGPSSKLALGGLAINAGGGDNTIQVRPQRLVVGGSAQVSALTGDDIIEVLPDNGLIQGTLAINAGGGADEIRVGGQVRQLRTGGLTITSLGAAPGTTVTDLFRVRVNGPTAFTFDSGNDVVFMNDSRLLALTAIFGGGDDLFAVDTSPSFSGVTRVLGALAVYMGGGNDTVTLGGADSGRRVVLASPAKNIFGGPGAVDQLFLNNLTQLNGPLNLGGFESVFS